MNGKARNICRILGWKFVEIPERLGRRWKDYVETYETDCCEGRRSLNSFRIVFKFEYVIWQCYLDQSAQIPDTRSPGQLDFVRRRLIVVASRCGTCCIMLSGA